MTQKLWTVREVLAWTRERFVKAALDSPRLDAEVLLAHALGADRVQLYLDLERPLDELERSRYRDLVARRLERQPVAYLVGEKEFWSKSFLVDERVLVPRPETETLVEQALVALRDHTAPRILDVGTGCGAVAVCLALERPDATVFACDQSAQAVAVARENALRLEAPVTFYESDLLDALGGLGEPFQLVVANLPYVAWSERETLPPELRFEPQGALFADDDGLAVLARLIQEAPSHLVRPGGRLLLEVGAGQADRVCQCLIRAGFSETIEVHRDLAGIERVVAAALPAHS